VLAAPAVVAAPAAVTDTMPVAAAEASLPASAPQATPAAAAVPAEVVVLAPQESSSASCASAASARNDDTPPWAVDDAPVRAQAVPTSDAVAMLAPEAAMAPPSAPAELAQHAAIASDAAVGAPASAATSSQAALVEHSSLVEPVVAAPSAAALPASSSATDASALLDDGRIADAEQWLELVTRSGLNGPSRQLAANAAFIGHRDGVLRLALAPGFEYLNSERSIANLAQALAPVLGNTPRIVIETGSADVETLHERANRQKGERQSAAETAFMNDPTVQLLIQQQGARLVPDSIRPYDE
ncbi:DNA polymerase III subunit gamma/tau, partial [Xanthomonas vasicola pv. vasculorum NCPPB 895]|uniref:DNA polymerase III subunit gamma/tau C-terminal domain-containing protein n=1 Tax=Xanthomonas vasicola TaxID=56459 RepID=UPI0004D43707